MWPFLRIGAALIAAPFFGARLVPVRMRVLLTVLITLVIMPMLPPMPSVAPLSAVGILVAIQQIMIGIAMGFVLQLVFNAATIAGESIAMTMGLGFASMVDPQNGVTTPVVSQFLVVVVTLLFITIDGHLMLIEIINQSFYSLPVGTTGISRDGFWVLVGWGSTMLLGALQIALPVVSCLLVIYLSLGVMTRAAPQLNIFSVGFPITLLAGFVLLWFVLPQTIALLERLIAATLELSKALAHG